MKHIYSILLLVSISTFSYAGGYEYTCTAKWINYKGDKKLYEAPEPLKEVYITFVENKLDTVKFRSKNQSSYYNFKKLLRPPHGGMVYASDNGNRLAVYNNSEMTILIRNGDMIKFVCPEVKISIGKIK
jgi:hypothetical protein